MHEITTEEIKNNAPSNGDVDLTYAISSSKAAGASSEHEGANIVTEWSGRLYRSSSLAHTCRTTGKH